MSPRLAAVWSRVGRSLAAGLFLFLLVGGLGGCAYFNAFYNTQHHFQLGEKERERSTNPDAKPAAYEDAVDAGGRLLEYHPDSEYVDETLFIMGQSYYWLQDYHKAKRKFEELISLYPDSPHIREARLWLGRCYVGMKMRSEATSSLQTIVAEAESDQLVGGALFALAELYYVDSLFVKATEEFAQVTEVDAAPELVGEAYWRAGEAAFRAGNHQQAVQYLDAARDYDLTRALQFKVRLLYGEALRLTGEPEEAIRVFKGLLKDKRYFEDHGRVRVHMGLALADLGRDEDAFQQWEEVVAEHGRTPEAARALYHRGMILLSYPGKREEAKEALDNARVEQNRALYAQKADTMLQLINRVDALNQARRDILLRTGLTESWIADPVQPSDTTALQQAAYYDSAAVDSLQLARLWSLAWRDSVITLSDSTADSLAGADGVEDSLATTAAHAGAPDSGGEEPPPGSDGELELPSAEGRPAPEDTMEAPPPPVDAEQISADTLEPAAPGAEFAGPVPPNPAEVNLLGGEEGLVLEDKSEETGAEGKQPSPPAGDALPDGSAPGGDDSGVPREPDSLEAADQPEEVERDTLTVFQPEPVLDSLRVMRSDLQEIRFQLGEILLFDLSEEDSARVIFRELAAPPNADSVRARATLALAWIAQGQGQAQQADSLMHLLAEKYPGTPYGLYASRQLGFATDVLVSPAQEAFQEAEEALLTGNFEDAYARYRLLVETHPQSPWAPRAMFAAAFIAGRQLHDPTTAEDLFNELASLYPNSSQAERAETILGNLQRSRQQGAQGDTLGIEEEFADLDAYGEEEVDSHASIIGGLESLASVLDSRSLLPSEVIQGTGGEVLLRYVVDEQGQASNFRVVLENPLGKGLARGLIQGLEAVTFRPAEKEGEQVAVRIERRYTLPLDAPPNVRPLPRRRRS